jgi:hypothetical protein
MRRRAAEDGVPRCSRSRQFLVFSLLGELGQERQEWLHRPLDLFGCQPLRLQSRAPVRLQPLDGCSPGRSQAHDNGEIFVPSEVLTPALAPRMLERDVDASHRIRHVDADELVVVTALARQRQVARLVLAAGRPWDDVLD